MAFKGQQVTVGTTATLITVADELAFTSSEGDQAGIPGQSVWLTVGAADIYLHGFNTVTTDGTKGRKVAAGLDVSIDLQRGESLWAITASGSSICQVGQQGV